MNEKLTKAILNNNDLYRAIFDSRNLTYYRTESIWYCLEKTPPLYSNLVTSSKTWQPDRIFEAIDSICNADKWDKWSIKDSFNVLNLELHGFTRLFAAQWVYLEAKNLTASQADLDLEYKIVETSDELSTWRFAWDLNEKLGKEIFKSQLLNHPNAHFVAGYDQEKIVTGCFLNKTQDLYGISNFFSPAKGVEYWAGLVNFIFEKFGPVDLVGYEQRKVVELIMKLGFESIGDLTVWIKKRPRN